MPPKRVMNDRELRLVADKLWFEIRKMLERELYISYDPREVFISTSGEVGLGPVTPVKTIREALYGFGVTLYHLATGKSPLTAKSKTKDFEFVEFKSDLWPLIEVLTSEAAVSVPQVDKLLKPAPLPVRLAGKALKPLLLLMVFLTSSVLRLGRSGWDKASEWIKNKLPNPREQLKDIWESYSCAVITVLVIVIILLPFVRMMWLTGTYFSCDAIIVCLFFTLFGPFVIAMLFSLIATNNESDFVGVFTALFAIMVFVFSLLGIYKTPSGNSVMNFPVVLVEKSSGEFYARIRDHEDRGYLPCYQGNFVNLFSKRYAPGICTQCEAIPVKVKLGNKDFCFNIKYAIINQETFLKDWQQMTKEGKKQADLEKELAEAGQAIAKDVLAKAQPPVEIEKQLTDIKVEVQGAGDTLSENDYATMRDTAANLVKNELETRQKAQLQQHERQLLDQIQERLKQQFGDRYNYIEVKKPKPTDDSAEKKNAALPPNARGIVEPNNKSVK